MNQNKENGFENNALGLIETFGYLAHIVAADACLKAANVKLLGSEKIKGGLMLLKVSGDVGAVIAGIEAVEKCLNGKGLKVVTHIIPNPSKQIEKILYEKKLILNELNDTNTVKQKDDESNESLETLLEEKNKKHNYIEQDNNYNLNDKKDILNRQYLSSLKVSELRSLARSFEGINMSKRQIKFGKKDELIEAIVNYLILERRNE